MDPGKNRRFPTHDWVCYTAPSSKTARPLEGAVDALALAWLSPGIRCMISVRRRPLAPKGSRSKASRLKHLE